ncbi:MAG: lysozyme inhibitor LprI family protein [Nanoarchaeota archaeon]
MRILVLVFCLLLIGNFCYAEPIDLDAINQHEIDKFEEDLIEQDWSTAGMANATLQAMEMWEEEMNKYYELLKEELKGQDREQLIKSQEAWLKFRDEEMKNISNIFGRLSGTMYINLRIGTRRELVKQRALDLKHYYQLP